MVQTIRPWPVAYSEIDLSWMIGRTVSQVSFDEPQLWSFNFGADTWLGVECLWRIIKQEKVALTNQDHGHKFGLPLPIDAVFKSSELLCGVVIESAKLREATADFTINFDDSLRLEVIPISCGYESWELKDPFGSNFYAQGGGQICQWKS